MYCEVETGAGRGPQGPKPEATPGEVDVMNNKLHVLYGVWIVQS